MVKEYLQKTPTWFLAFYGNSQLPATQVPRDPAPYLLVFLVHAHASKNTNTHKININGIIFKKSKSAIPLLPRKAWNCCAVCWNSNDISDSRWTSSSVCLAKDEKLSFSKAVQQTQSPQHALQTGVDLSLPRFHQDTFWLIHVASMPLWGHFWQRWKAWSQGVKDHERTFGFKITGAEITIKRIPQGFKCLWICCLKSIGKTLFSVSA